MSLRGNKRRVLFLCTHNSARSQIAEGLLKYLASSEFEVESAGSCPCGVNPYAVKVLSELDIDASKQYSKNLSDFLSQEFDYVITVCDNADQNCPVFPGKYVKLHWPLSDPGHVQGSDKEVILAFRNTRDKLKKLIIDFIKSNS